MRKYVYWNENGFTVLETKTDDSDYLFIATLKEAKQNMIQFLKEN